MKEVKIMHLCNKKKKKLLDTNDKILQNNNGKTYHIPVFFVGYAVDIMQLD